MKYQFEPDQNISDVWHITPPVFEDDRGWFKEMFSSEYFDSKIGPFPLVSFSKTREPGSVRGLHFQEGADAQGKLVSCTAGSIFDLALDIRRGSKTFGKWTSTVLSPKNHKMFWIPPGFAHGFQALEEDTEVLYFCSNNYRPESERVISVFDERLMIDWPLEITKISEKDKLGGSLSDLIENW